MSVCDGISLFGKATADELHRKLPKGRLLITELRIPFVWDERQYFKRRKGQSQSSAEKKFVVFCILYTENDMQSTQKVMVDSSMADVVFNELLEFSSITPNTRLFMEVFCYACSTGNGKNVSPVRQLSKKLSRSLSRAFGRRLNANQQPGWIQHSSSVHAELHAAEHRQSPTSALPASGLHNFTKIAEAVIHLDDLISGEEGRSHILTAKIPQKGADRYGHHGCEIPLFGSFSCRTAVQPQCATREVHVGNINIRELDPSARAHREDSNGATGTSYSCTLVNAYLYCYNTNRDRRLMEMAIRIDQRTKIFRSPDSCGLELVDHQMGTYLLNFLNAEERKRFMKVLLVHINELSQWSDAALHIRDLKMRTSNIKNEIRRRGSLYDEIPLSMQSDVF